jgi:carotenoid cleavage dioxygenase-like enzyme
MLSLPTIKIPEPLFVTGYRLLQRLAPYSPRNKYIEGPFAPVTSERVDTDLVVTGTIPVELNGIFARIGPNPIHIQNPGKHHWFLGDGMVHGVKITKGQFTWYRNRWVGTDSVNDYFQRPRLSGSRRGLIDAVNTNIISHAGRIWALIEAGAFPAELNNEFETIKHGLFDGGKNAPYSAHPHLDPETGELHAICYAPNELNQVTYVVVDANSQVCKIENIPLGRSTMVHDCAITQKYVLVFDFPVLLSVKGGLTGEQFPYHWKENSYSRIGLMPRHGSAKDIRWCKTDACYAFHACNAFDQADGSVVLDLVVHDAMFVEREGGPEVSKTNFERWILEPDTGTIARKVISTEKQEFPRFDERLSTKPYRYAYTIGASLDFVDEHPLYRHDLITGQTITRNFGPNRGPNEVNFVPRHPDSEENDGWLLTFVTDFEKDITDFVILDAQDIMADPIASIRLPWRLPLGFHSNWIAAFEN